MASDQVDYDPRFNPVYQRGHEDDPVPGESAVAEQGRDPQPQVRRNPWLVILWILAIAILAAGLWAQWYSQKLLVSPNIDNVADYYIIPNVLAGLAPWFVVVGLASVVGAVFLHAVRWGRA